MSTNTFPTSKMKLPGIGLPLQQKSGLRTEGRYGNWYEHALPLTIRERVMMDIMARLKDKMDWERKVFDDAIVSKWRDEALSSTQLGPLTNPAPHTGSIGDLQQTNNDDEDDYGMNSLERQRVVSEEMFQYVCTLWQGFLTANY